MRLTRRIVDALRGPARLAGLLRRIGELTASGQLEATLRRLRPRSFSVDEYRAWRAAGTPRAADAPGVRLAILRDAGERDAAAAPGHGADAEGGSVAVRSVPEFLALDGVDWLVWIAQSVWLAPGALAALARGCAVPGARLVYADHDVDDMPAFKCAWDTWQVLETDYAGPLLAVHRSQAGEIDGDGADALWRLCIASAARVPDEAVVHVPAIAAHLRDRRPSSRAALRSAVAAAVVDAARSRGLSLSTDPHRTPWVRYADGDASVSVVVPTRDRPELLERCLDSVIATKGARDVEVIVVDNASVDPGVPAVLERAGASIALRHVRDGNPFNFPRLCNAGVRVARGRVVVLLNNDTIVPDGWLDELAALAVQPGVGAVGPLLVYPDGRLQSAGVLVGVNRTATSALSGFAADDPAAVAWCANRRRVSAVLGACVAILRATYVDAGGLDERFGVSHNEVDFGLRLEARGLANLFTPFARVVHHEGATRGFEVTAQERERLAAEERLFRERWAARLARCDPAYHPALARHGTPFALGPAGRDALPRAGWGGASG